MTPQEAARIPAVIARAFETRYEPVPGNPANPRAVDWAFIVKKGSNGSEYSDKVERLKKHNAAVWSVIEPAYAAWKKGQEEPTSGTPLSVWPGVDRAMADRLRMFHLRTVEDVAEMTEGTLELVGMGARAMRDRARTFVEAGKGRAVVAEAMAEKDKQIADMQAEIAELKAAVEQLAADRPRRGRPPNVARAEAAE